ncbi:MAG: SleB-like protein [Sphingomonas bacterium]|jgi:spore germination cell wall hydrolase CwlJ-like protein|uniref:cell wall hydrolase n=1 Tax=Sphingomonas bacterium TaxID=1895847 RepID=UPI0026160889|nr:cell wall hydrolase [Sphingomonas bacterium]MDB5706613.1 SleB-like protein [Sphingomonas bacterium]
MPDLPAPPGKPGFGLNLLLSLVALLAIALPLLIVLRAPPVIPHRPVRPLPQRVVPQAEIPPVEPVAFQDLDPDDARAFNATVPFSTGPNPAARPFKFVGTDEQRARAIDCLAAGVLYEAGDDPEGQRAVAQVVINRARHPAFPKTICGVVFQGYERPTGCQFTFTCDGALAKHHWPDAAWVRARATATAALSGAVYRPVGYATHYHTDWVVPYWQSSLDKIAAVHTHLFFRWTGWWGTPPAFGRHVSSDEPVIAPLALYSDAHKTGATLVEASATAVEAAALGAALPPALTTDTNSFLMTLDPHMPPDAFALLAARTCGDRPYCKIMGWTSKAKTPGALPLQPTQIAAMSFSYLRDRAHNYDKSLWNCGEFKRADLSQCMKLQVFVPVARQADNFRLESLPGTTRVLPPPVTSTIKPADAPTTPRRKVDAPPSTARPAAVIPPPVSPTQGR